MSRRAHERVMWKHVHRLHREAAALTALAEQSATYEPLCTWLGGPSTLHGGLMVVGAVMSGWWAPRAW
jgi:hypothetical protein